MRRTKLILAAVAAVATMMLVAAPAMADVELQQGGVGNSFSSDGGGSFSSQGVLSLGGSSHGDISFDGVDIDDIDTGDGGFILVGGLSSVG